MNINTKFNPDFLMSCVNNKYCAEYEALQELVKGHADPKEIKNLLIKSVDPEIKKSHAYAYASVHSPRHEDRLEDMLKEHLFTTDSDAGSVMVGTEDAKFFIPNWRGDGRTSVAVVEKDKWNNDMADFFTFLSGEMDIYDYDCSGAAPLKHLSGRYGVYIFPGIVIFEKWD